MGSKCVLLAPTPPPAGGIAGWTVRMMKAQLKNGWTLELVDEKLIGNREVFGNNNRKCLIQEVKRCLKIWKSLYGKLKDGEVKVVHSCIPSAFTSMLREYVCACITKANKKKFVMHFRCTIPNTTKGMLSNFLLKLLCRKCDAIIILNKASMEYLRRITDVPLYLIPNFIDAEEMTSNPSVRGEIKRVIYVGGVTKDKGCDTIIEVAKEFSDIEFRLVGKQSEEIVELAKQVNNVVLTGTKDNRGVREEFVNADVFMFLSHFYGEGFSNALAEAMGFGLPCIVTNWAANADMIEDKGGMVVPVDDIEATIRALNMIREKNVREEQSRFNLEKVRTMYAADVIIDRYVDVYETIL